MRIKVVLLLLAMLSAVGDPSLTHQDAHTITRALHRLGVINLLDPGKAGLNGGKATKFSCEPFRARA